MLTFWNSTSNRRVRKGLPRRLETSIFKQCFRLMPHMLTKMPKPTQRGTYTEAGGKQDERNRAQLQGASVFVRRGGHKMRDKRLNQNNLSKSSHMSCQPSFCSFLLPKPDFLIHLSFSAISPSAISQHAEIPLPMLPKKRYPRIFYVIPDQLLRSIHLSTVIPIRTLLKRPSSCHC